MSEYRKTLCKREVRGISCLECGIKRLQLHKHIRAVHSMSPEEYLQLHPDGVLTGEFALQRSPESNTKRSTSLVGRQLSQESIAKMTASLRVTMSSPEVRKKLSIAKARAVREGRHRSRWGKCGFFYSEKNQRQLHYRSESLELAFFRVLEKLDQVRSYRVEPFSIPYVWQGVTRSYTPDVLIEYTSGALELVELKPEYVMSDPRTQAKLEAGRLWCEGCRRQIQFRVLGYIGLRAISQKGCLRG